MKDKYLALELNETGPHVYEEEIVILNCLVEKNPQVRNWFVGRGHAYFALGNYSKAIEDDTTAIEIDQHSKDGRLVIADDYYGRAMSLQADHQYKAALNDYEEIVKLSPSSYEGAAGMCAVQALAYSLDETVASCQDAIDRFPPEKLGGHYATEPDRWLAIAYFRAGQYPLALSHAEQALALTKREKADNPEMFRPRDNAPYLYARGVIKLRMGDQTGGQADIKSAKRLDPHVTELWDLGISE